eukprot:m.140967 g.140967  ORF g.140967 m.140967 type:complete len:476 (+) comp30153_c0_seq2:376-1803(+)
MKRRVNAAPSVDTTSSTVTPNKPNHTTTDNKRGLFTRRLFLCAVTIFTLVLFRYQIVFKTASQDIVISIDCAFTKCNVSALIQQNRNRPILFRNSAATTWPAVKLWQNVSYLVDTIGPTMMENVYSQPENISLFLNYDDTAMLAEDVGDIKNHTILKMNATTFFARATKFSKQHHFRYWSGNLDGVGLHQDINNVEILRPTPTKLKALRGWFASKGVAAQLHYDTFHNTFVQVSGVKQFKLYPPTQLSNARLYPSLHPGYRQSQVVCDAEAACLPEESVITVEAGMAMYIPPFWLHSVDSLTDTLSVNIWTEDPVLMAAEGIFKEPIPFEPDWSHVRMATALVWYLDILIVEVLKESMITPALFYAEWLESRYSTLVDVSFGVDQNEKLWMPLTMPDGFHASEYCDFSQPKVPSNSLQNAALRIASRLSPLANEIKIVFLQDLVEEMVSAIVGRRHVVVYTRQCLLTSKSKRSLP